MSSAAFLRRPPVVLILGLCLVGGGVSLISRLATGPSNQPIRVALPHEGGSEAAPAFSPDGRRLAYSQRETGKDSPYHIRVRTLAGGAVVALTDGPASDLGPAWSPDGASIAFLRVDDGRARYMVVASQGGAPRQVADFPVPDPAPGPQPAVSWGRDGQSLYIVEWTEGQPPAIGVVPAAGGAVRRVTAPAAGSRGDGSPAISPDGATLAFVRQSAERAAHGDFGGGDGNGADVFLCDVSGSNPRRLTFENAEIVGIAWSADGREVIYAANRSGREKLWRIDASGGSPRNVVAEGRAPAFPTVARAGHRLAFTETPSLDTIWRIDLTAADPASTARMLIRSDGREQAPSWSPDGTKIANISTHTGNDEIWVGDAEGRNRAPITHLKAWRLGWPRWSPDGRTLLFLVRGNGTMEVDRVASDGRSAPVRLQLPEDAQQVAWSHDGAWIYYQSMAQIWKAHVDGRERQKLTNQWGDGEPKESPDGKYVYFRRERAVWRTPSGGGADEEVVEPNRDARWNAFQVAPAGLYLLELDRDERTISLLLYDLQSKKSRELVRLPVTDPSSVGTFSVSTDGRYLLYPAVDRAQTSLALAENFR